ncbi:MAG TPA: hypothetical protein VMW24_05060 [Sedimentisphaerales bacterium]|nr:hypothetical protein [Sedimentisphaerales bacterium]
MTQLLKSYCTVILCLWCVGENCTAEVVTNTKMSPPLAGGVIAIWLQSPTIDREAILKMPVVKGGQVMVQWAEVEPEKGTYDFSSLDSGLADYAQRGLPVTVQLNGNRKPHYLFNEVPFVKETGRDVPAFRQVMNREGTLMYWHPAHEQAYVNCLTAFRDHLASSVYKKSIIGLRMNFNPFGTEGINIWPQQARDEYARRDRWIQPPGLDHSLAYNGFNKKDGLDYVRRIIRQHIELFSGVVPMFMRSTVDSEVLAEFSEYLENGTFGVFETGSCLAPFSTKSEASEAWILKYCKSGKTIGYAESFADAWGVHGVKDDLVLSPPQAFYWRVLCDLHKGASYVACYGRDLNVALTGSYAVSSRTTDGKSAQILYSDSQSGWNYRHEFSESLRWADKYAGCHADPERAPGAWIAFRQSNAVANARARSFEKLRLPDFASDYTYLMERLPDQSVGASKIGPESIRYGGYARRVPARETIRLKVNERFLQSLQGPCWLSVTYFDDASGSSFSVSASGQTWKVPLRGGQIWQTAIFEVTAPVFQSMADGPQITIQNSHIPVCLHMVAIERE